MVTRADLNPVKMKDWEIAEAAEAWMKPFLKLGRELGLKDEEMIPMGKFVGKVDYQPVLERLKNAPMSKYIDVTAITPTPLGEGKTTTSMASSMAWRRSGRWSSAPFGSRAAAQRSTSKARRLAVASLSAFR